MLLIRAHRCLRRLSDFPRSPSHAGARRKPEPKRIVILEFPDAAAVKRWYNSPEYQKILPGRLEKLDRPRLIVEGVS